MSGSDWGRPRKTYESLSVFQKPVCLIENGPDNKLKIRGEVLNELKRITHPVKTIAITGPYRTGKSYLLNYLAGKKTGFPLGSSIHAKTKGIWVWCHYHPKMQNEVLLLLDTEGLGDPDKGDEENDNWIFALAVLLSSTLVYNSFSTINQDGITKLHYVTELTKRMKARNTSKNEDGREFFKLFPNFVWIVRDFCLDMVDKGGKRITADEYLNYALQLKKGTSPKIEEYNKPRRCIRQFFADKKCFVYPRPVEDQQKLKNLEKLSDLQLQPTFLREAKAFCSYIYTQTFPKTAKGQPINGKMFCHLLETYLAVIQSGEIPCVENAVKNMAEKENCEAVKVSFHLYEAQMKELLQKSNKTEEELSKSHLSCSSRSLERFMSMSTLDDKQIFQAQLKEEIGNKYKEIRSQWEQDHGGSASVEDDLKKKNIEQLTEVEELNQHLVQLQTKLEQEKENALKEINRLQQQRENELKDLEKMGETSEALSQQAQDLVMERKQMESDLEKIRKGGEDYAGFLYVGKCTLSSAVKGGILGARIVSCTGNPLVVALATVVGAAVGGAIGLYTGLTTVKRWWS